jgi:hypothetical protein
MRPIGWLTVGVLGLVFLVRPVAVSGADIKASKSDAPAGKGECGKHGTTVEFLDTPSEAARKAQKEQKLVFVLHVSGNFEDPRFT